MKIELIHPPHYESIEDRLDAPLGLLYIASILENAGHEVRVNDLAGTPRDKWNIQHADLYGMTTYVTTIPISKEIAGRCKEVNPHSKVIVGGAHPTARPYDMNKLFDIVVKGEGELAFLDIIKDYPHNKKVYQRALEKDLDLYPNPAYHLVDLNSYKRTIDGEPSITMLTSRGCPFRCSFCGLDETHKTVKFRSPEAVVEEIKEIKERYGITKFNFQDDTFTMNKKRLYTLLDLLTPLNIGFRCHGRAGLDIKEDYVKLKKAGCDMLSWGIESGSQKMLDLMNKRSTVKQNENVIKLAKKNGITSRAFFILGFPGETRETVEETKSFIERTNPDQYFVSNFVPYPDTDVWNNPDKYGIIKMNKDFSNYFQVDKTGYGSVNIETRDLSSDEFKEIEKEFRTWINKRERKGSLLCYEKELEDSK